MTSTVERRPAPAGPPRAQQRPAPPVKRPLPWATALSSGVAVLLAGAPVTAIVQDSVWPAQAALAVVPVVAVGIALFRLGHVTVVVGQLLALLMLLTVRFTDQGVLGVLPGPAAFGEFGGLIDRAGGQIDTSVAPVAATTEIRFLVTAAFGLLTIGVFAAAVAAAAPAAAGVPLLAVFAVPAALADDLLPWWTMVCAAVGYGLLLVAAGTGTTVRTRTGTGVALVAVGVVIALATGAGTGFVGTAGRFEGGGLGAGSTSSIGLSPFTALRGQLDRTAPIELFRVRGLTRPTYLRALTLRDYVPGIGWQASPPAPGTPLPGNIPADEAGAGDQADIQIENIAFRDYWLPLYGDPLEVAGLPEGQWQYDPEAGTGYSVRPKAEDGWQQRALLPNPTADDLRASGDGTQGADPVYLDARNVDPRVSQLADQITRGAKTDFDRTMALQDFFTGPDSQFRYDLKTAPGNGDDALVEFLTVGKVGYCEQFASAMATMLRTVGVPARVAVGFTAGTEIGQYRSISTEDAHAWVEAWFPGNGWVTFDPTPLTDGRAITPPYVDQARGEAAGQDSSAQPDELTPQDATPTPEAPAPQLAEPTPPPTAAPTASGFDPLTLWPVLLGLLVLAAIGAPAGLRIRSRRRRLATVHAGGPGAADAGWAELLAESVDRGVAIPPTDTVRGAARRLVREHRLGEPAQQALRAVVTAVETSWYGGGHPAPGQLDAAVREVATGIGTGSGITLRQRLLPRSVLRRQHAGHAPAEENAPVG